MVPNAGNGEGRIGTHREAGAPGVEAIHSIYGLGYRCDL
jgi:hypothetical protein